MCSLTDSGLRSDRFAQLHTLLADRERHVAIDDSDVTSWLRRLQQYLPQCNCWPEWKSCRCRATGSG